MLIDVLGKKKNAFHGHMCLENVRLNHVRLSFVIHALPRVDPLRTLLHLGGMAGTTLEVLTGHSPELAMHLLTLHRCVLQPVLSSTFCFCSFCKIEFSCFCNLLFALNIV